MHQLRLSKFLMWMKIYLSDRHRIHEPHGIPVVAEPRGGLNIWSEIGGIDGLDVRSRSSSFSAGDGVILLLYGKSLFI